VTGPAQAVVPARVPLRRLREGSRPSRTGRGLLMDLIPWTVPALVCVALAIGAVHVLGRLLTEPGWAVPGAPGRLFAVAAGLLLLGGLAQLLRSGRAGYGQLGALVLAAVRAGTAPGPTAPRAAGVLAFGSLATGVGRADLSSAIRAPPGAALILLATLAVIAVACCALGYQALDRIEVSVLRRGQGLWTAGHVAAASMDVFMLTEFLADQRARQAGRVRSARMGNGFAGALARSEWTRLRRRPALAVHAAAAAVVWWGCRPVLPGPALAAVALIVGYCLVLPVAGTLRQLAANPGLRAQFAPRDRWLSFASLAACLLASATWTAIVAPGLSGGIAQAALIAAGLSAAAYRTVTRRPLDYSGPLAPTPFGDYPLGLWLQVLRGPLLLAVLTAVTAANSTR
jgi:Family of unknown function (DUF6297)